MTSVKKRFGIQVIVSNLEVVGNLSLSILLARLLSPEDIGVYSMSAVLVAVAHIFRDFGVSSFLLREKELDWETLRSAMGVVMFTSWLVAATMFFSAPMWASFFNEPRVENVVRVLALGFILIPFGALPGAILVRNMEVAQTAKASAIALTAYFTVSVALALKDFGQMTMAWASLANIATHVLAVRWFSRTPTPLIPGFKNWARVAHFGIGAITTSAMTAVNAAIPDIFLGRLSTPAAVGFFSKSNSTVHIASSVVMPAVNYFALPYMARLHHANANLADEICRVTSYLAALLLPAMVVTAILSEPLIGLLYGEKWLPSATAVPWLCVSAGVAVLFTFTPSALTGIGRPYLAGFPLAILLALKTLLVLLMFDGSLPSFARALALAQVLTLPIYLWVIHRYLGIGLRKWSATVFPVLVLTSILGMVIFSLKGLLPPMPAWLTLLALGSAAAGIWLVLLRLIDLPLYKELHALFTRQWIVRP